VPIAITVLGGSELDRNVHIRLEDLNQLSPSTVVVITNGHQTTMSIRGIGNNPGSDGLENSAGVFVDGVYLGRPGMVSMDLIDIKQIEELRGPQGTLFGKNTTAGAINITTELPSYDWGLKGAVTYGNYNYLQLQGSVTGPITKDLAFRVTAYSTTRNGDIYDVANGQMVNTLNRNGVRAQLLYKPDDDFSIRLIGEYSAEQQSTGAVLGIAAVDPLALTKLTSAAAAIGGTLITNPYKGEIAQGLVIDPTGQYSSDGGPYDTGTRQGAGSAEINWKFGGFTLTSLTAFRYWQYRSHSDTEGSSANVLSGGYYIQDRQWTQEFRLAFPRMGNIDLISGVYYFNQYIRTDQHVEYGEDAAAWLTGLPNATLNALAAAYQYNPVAYAAYKPIVGVLALNNSSGNTYADPLTHSLAGFAQGTWHIMPQWNFTGGVRVTYETKKEDVWSATAASPHIAISDTAPSWLASTDYHPMPGLMVYGTISHGEKAGGLNTTLLGQGSAATYAVPPETATNYEVGMKGDWFRHRLVVNFDLFRMDVHDYQANVEETIGTTLTSLITSAGKVRTQGAEFEATVVPVTGISLHGFAGYNDAKYLSYLSGPCPVEVTFANPSQTSCNLSGRPVVGAPKWTMGANGLAETPVTEHQTIYFSPEISWRSHYYGSADDSTYSVTGGYVLVNLRAGIRDTDGHWDLSVWGRNVTNKHYINNYFNYGSFVPGAYAAVFGDPATYGATFRVKM
jgi:iron complex outermembrane receptor protein